MQRWMIGIVVAVTIAMSLGVRTARADGIVATEFGDFNFILPEIGKNWEKEKKPGLILVSDESDTAPDLTIAVFAPSKPGTLKEIEARLQTELARPDVVFYGEKVKTFKVDKSADETISATPFRTGTATFNGSPAAFAIGQRGGKTIILVAVANEGVEQRALANFQATIHKLLAARGGPPSGEFAPPPDGADASEPFPKLDTIVGLQDATASSTYPDKSKKDSYAAWRILDFESVENAGLDVPPYSWCEGKPDEGIGENVTLTLAGPTKIDELKIAAGVWLNQKLFDSNNRITALSLSLDGGPAIKLSPKAKREWLSVKVGKPITTIKLTIDAVTKGKMNDSCISGVEVIIGEDGQNVVRGVDAKAMSALPAFYAAIEKAMNDPARAGLDKLIAFPFSYAASDWFLDGSKRKAQKIANAKALETACKKHQPACPGGPNTGGRDDLASIGSPGPGKLTIRFPSRREVIDVWHVEWKNGAWKLASVDYQSP